MTAVSRLKNQKIGVRRRKKRMKKKSKFLNSETQVLDLEKSFKRLNNMKQNLKI